MFEAADHRSDEHRSESDYLHNQEAVQGMLGRLDDRERRILVSRYGIGGANELTLERLGRELGITKERVRQIQSQAQEKLREFARARRIFSRKITCEARTGRLGLGHAIRLGIKPFASWGQLGDIERVPSRFSLFLPSDLESA